MGMNVYHLFQICQPKIRIKKKYLPLFHGKKSFIVLMCVVEGGSNLVF